MALVDLNIKAIKEWWWALSKDNVDELKKIAEKYDIKELKELIKEKES